MLFIPHSRKASFFKESELVLQFDMDQKIIDAVTSQHTHDFKIVKILFEQQASTLSAEQIISFRTGDSAGRDSLYNFKQINKEKIQRNITLVVIKTKVNSMYANQRIYIYKTSFLRLIERMQDHL